MCSRSAAGASPCGLVQSSMAYESSKSRPPGTPSVKRRVPTALMNPPVGRSSSLFCASARNACSPGAPRTGARRGSAATPASRSGSTRRTRSQGSRTRPGRPEGSTWARRASAGAARPAASCRAASCSVSASRTDGSTSLAAVPELSAPRRFAPPPRQTISAMESNPSAASSAGPAASQSGPTSGHPPRWLAAAASGARSSRNPENSA